MEIASKKQIKLIIFTIMLGSFLTSLTQMVLTSALPGIMKEFNVNANTAQWLTTAYLLVLGIMIPTTAYLINTFTTRKLFISSMVLFFIGCVLSIVSRDFNQMIVSRVLQAIGAGVIMQLVQVAMISLYPPEERGKAMGIYGFTVGLAPMFGPIVAGYIIDSIGWRALFYILGSIAIIDIILAIILLKNFGEIKKSKLEVISVILSTIGFGGLLSGASNIGNYGLSNSLTYIPLMIGILGIGAFVVRQFKIENPLLELRVFKDTNFKISTVLICIVYAAMTSATVIITIYVQSVRGYSAFISGLVMLPGSMLMAILSPITGRILDKHGPRLLTISGFAFLGIGTFSLSTVIENTPLYYLSIMFVFRMIGISFLLMPITAWGLRTLELDEVSHGSAISSTLRQVSGAIGSAVIVAIMTSITNKSVSNSIMHASIEGISAAFKISSAIIIIGFIGSIMYVKGNKEKKENRKSEGNKDTNKNLLNGIG